MAFDLGDVVTLSVTVRDEAGAPANAGAVTATVTAPDGTTSATPVSNPSAGVYTSAYTRRLLACTAIGSLPPG